MKDNVQGDERGRALADLGTPLPGWVRFSEYELWRGAYIRPKADAELVCYDPWHEFEASKAVTGGQPPYIELFNLLDDLNVEGLRLEELPKVVSSHGPRNARYAADVWVQGELLDSNQSRRLLEWCSHWGLLGALPNDLLGFECHTDPEGTSKRWTSFRIRRESGRFVSDAIREYGGPWWDKQPKPLGEAFCIQDDEKHWFLKSPIADISHLYFEGDRYGAFMPMPLSRTFWLDYRETVEMFLFHALNLRLGSEMLSSRYLNSIRDPHDAHGFQEKYATWIARYLDPAGSTVERGKDGKLLLKRQFPSLLSAFAQMIVEDLVTDGHRLVRCPSCQRQFVARSYQTEYCSQQCGWRDRKQKLRGVQKRALALRSEGVTLKEIADQLNSSLPADSDRKSRVSVTQIKEWLKKGKADGKTSRK